MHFFRDPETRKTKNLGYGKFAYVVLLSKALKNGERMLRLNGKNIKQKQFHFELPCYLLSHNDTVPVVFSFLSEGKCSGEASL